MEAVGVVRQDGLGLPVGRGDERQVNQLPVHARGDRLGVQDRADRLPLGEVGHAAAGELDPGHGTLMISAARGPPEWPSAYSYEMASSTLSLAARRAGKIAKKTPSTAA